ncbi:MAG: hypothetical protein FJ304_21495 [Planctomycetes bacterium]|nr:hypothetical protein [Planctomycetota bacterium]
MSQTTKWNWKRVAANLLLVPLLAGGAVAVVHAQFGKGGPTTGAPGASAANRAPGARPSTGDPKQLLKDGRTALAEGRYTEAQDLAQAAESNNPGGKWGLFDDTPTALRKDIQSAKAKADRAQSEALVKQAKALAAKPAQNEAERAYNLDTALQMARRADGLHGPYSAWDMGDRADKLVKELQDARAKIKAAPTRPAGNPGDQIATRPGTTPGGIAQTGYTNTPDAKKQAATKLMADGRALADQDNFAGAKAKFLEADKLSAPFAPNEYSPGYALQELNARGAAAMDRLLRDAQGHAANGDFVKANVCLTSAGTVAASLGLYSKPVDEAKAALYIASVGKFGTAPPSGVAPIPGAPEHLIPAGQPGGTVPTVPRGTQTVYGGGAPGTPAGTNGAQLLAQAEIEFKAGEFDTAERLARQAHNLGLQEKSRALLTSIDTERYARKQRVAAESVKNARTAYEQKDYERAVGVLVLIDANLLSDEAKAARAKMLSECRVELAKLGKSDVVAVGGTQPVDKTPLPGPGDLTNPPGTARVTDNGASTADALRTVQFQKLRSEGLKVQADAQAAFGRGETDLAMQMLVEYSNWVRASGLDVGSIGRLLRPVEGRLQTFQMMKGQADALARQNKDKRDAKEMIASRGIAEEDRKQAVAANMRAYHDLVKKGDLAGAERVALRTKQLDPDDPAVGAMYEMAKLTRRVKEAEQIKAEREKFFLGGMNDNERIGPLVTHEDPVAIKLDSIMRSRQRGSGNDHYLRTRTPAEFEIELKMEKPVSIEFTQTPLDQAVANLKQLTGLPLEIDRRALADENISEVRPVTLSGGTPVAAKHLLAFTLDQAGLSYVIERDMVIVTTTKKSKGRMVTKVFSVADLVTPVPNFALPDYTNFDKMLSNNPLKSGNLVVQGLNTPGSMPTPHLPTHGLGGGQPASVQTGGPTLPGQFASAPGIQQTPYAGGGNRLETSPLAGSSNVTYANNSKHEQLIKLVTSMVRPFTWDGHGGAGKIEYFDIGHALVVNQTADVVTEVQDLLEALRRLQDLAVAVEVRIVSLAESFYERMGIDFSVNIKTNTTKFEPALTSGTFRPAPFINDINNTGVTVGLTPAGTFTPDLDVPLRTTTFNRAIPGFGNYPNAPGNNGGLAFGLAFLNDIQVYTFMEMAQGDQRSNIMQAPKLTLFNGQTATLGVQDSQFFVTSVQVLSVNGQIIFVPQNQPLNGPDTSINVTIQAIVSADRRFVRLNLPLQLAAQAGASVPLFPVTTFITPVFEGGSQGQPVPFTQFLQQPAFTSLNIQSSVVCPDGGTVILGGLKTMRESRNEFGPPFLSKIPYLNRLFKNVGVGREGRHVMVMVTPRIIINSEEEIIQTEGRVPGAPGGP